MSNFVELSLPEDFDGTVRIFPLPNLVLFPGVVQALHIFEPRYREMAAQSLAGDRLIAMALLAEDQYDEVGMPKIAQTVCIGKIVSEAKLEDGRYNLMLVGAKRAKIIRELDTLDSFRSAEVQVQHEPLQDTDGAELFRAELLGRFRQLADLNPNWDSETLQHLFDPHVPLTRVVDMITYASGFDPSIQQHVLETIELRQRVALVIQFLEDHLHFVRQTQNSRREFPPRFSEN